MALIDNLRINQITQRIIACAIRIHRAFGPGLLEAPYKLALAIEFLAEDLTAVCEVPLPVIYQGQALGTGYKMDFVVEDTVVVEVKAIDALLQVHRQQLLTYVKLSGYPAGLLINFNAPLLKDGLVRVLNDRPGKK